MTYELIQNAGLLIALGLVVWLWRRLGLVEARLEWLAEQEGRRNRALTNSGKVRVTYHDGTSEVFEMGPRKVKSSRRGTLAAEIDAALANFQGAFVLQDMIDAVGRATGIRPKSPSVCANLARRVKAGTVKILKRGSGRVSSVYARKEAPDEGIVETGDTRDLRLEAPDGQA